VWVIPSDPANAGLHGTATQVLDWSLTGGPYTVGAGFVAYGFLRRRRALREQRNGEGTYGRGLGSETIERLLAKQRGPEAEPDGL
jgi:hypothetical protein